MKIGGFQKSTFIDYPNHIAALIFTIECNFRCPYCYNKSLVKGTAKPIPEKKIFSVLKERKNLLEGLVITGGEPALQKDLPEFAKKTKDLGYKVKLDTNGTNPKMLRQLIESNLLDYVAMDIKAPIEKYKDTVKTKVNTDKVKKSVKIIKTAGKENKIDYEFRTTVLPKILKEKDIIKISDWIKGSKKYYLQQFKSFEGMLNPKLKKEKKYTEKKLKEIVDQIKDKFEKCEIRND